MFQKQKIISLSISQEEFLDLAAVLSEEKGSCVFFSGGGQETSKTSFLCLYPQESVWIKEKKIFHLKPGTSEPVEEKYDNPWDGLKSVISDRGPSAIPDWVGYLGYEMGACADVDKVIPCQYSSIPEAYFCRPSLVLKVNHPSGEICLFSREGGLSRFPNLRTPQDIKRIVEEGKQKRGFSRKGNLALVKGLEDPLCYKQKIEQAKKLILEGEIYQVNLSQQFLMAGEVDCFQIFQKIAVVNPAPFMAYLSFPGFTIVSSSPERFLCSRGGRLESRPIKGTAPRGKTASMDEANQVSLLVSPKEKAELLMITDLMRHDLAKVSQTGTVVTEEIWRCEAFTNVFHLSSVIHSRVKLGQHPVDIVRQVFPGGSITGCPKLRAMEIIFEIEKRARGIYTGSIGYFCENGDFDFNIAIRTILFKDGMIDVQLGGGIVTDSDPKKEYEEILHKGESIFETLFSDC